MAHDHDHDHDASCAPEAHLSELGAIFMRGVEARTNGQVDAAIEAFEEALRKEPRLAEPRIELGGIALDAGRLDDAEAHAREAIRILDAGGQWTEDVPENVLLGMAWALLGAALKAHAASDEVVFGEDPARFRELVEQSAAAFAKAAQLDPEDHDSAVNAAELKDDGEGST
jgi:tetratricopeptide (TPR) repeat protein